MSILSKKNTVIVVCVLLIVIILGVRQKDNQQIDLRNEEIPQDAPSDDKTSILDSLSQEDLEKLETALEALEFEDLGGLPEIDVQSEEQDTVGTVSQEELDALIEALEALEFEDLGGLSG